MSSALLAASLFVAVMLLLNLSAFAIGSFAVGFGLALATK